MSQAKKSGGWGCAIAAGFVALMTWGIADSGFGMIVFMIAGGLAVYHALKAMGVLDEAAPRPKPAGPPPTRVVAAPQTFSIASLAEPAHAPPPLEPGIMAFSRNEQVVQTHANFLNNTAERWSQTLVAAHGQYDADRRVYEGQQAKLGGLVKLASATANRLDRAFPRLAGDVPAGAIQPVMPVAPKPTIFAIGDYNTRVGRITNAAGAFGRQAFSHPLLAVTALAVSAVMIAREYQRAVRELQDSHGQVRRYVEQAKGDMALLARSHDEMVAASGAIAGYVDELEVLLPWADAQLAAGAHELDADAVAKVRRIKQLAMLPQLQVARAV